MNKLEFVAAVAKVSSLTSTQVASALKGIEEVSAAQLRDAGTVRVPGLVTIKRMERSERLVRNPRSGVEFVMGASVMVKAKPTTAFADRVKDENPVSQ